MRHIERLFTSILFSIGINCFAIGTMFGLGIFSYGLLLLSLIVMLLPTLSGASIENEYIKKLTHGCDLLVVLGTSEIISSILYFLKKNNLSTSAWKINACIILIFTFISFLVAITQVIKNSDQLSPIIKIVGVVGGLIPGFNAFVYLLVGFLGSSESSFEKHKDNLNKARRGAKVCKTQYPIILVDGIEFKESKYNNYWGRIPKELIKNGASVYHSKTKGCVNIKEGGTQLYERVANICKETNCGKVNIIAFGKGGLDVRYAMDMYGFTNMIASVTTINTPHYGCTFADYVFNVMPIPERMSIANRYQSALTNYNDFDTNYLQVLSELTTSSLTYFNGQHNNSYDVFCQSITSKAKNVSTNIFPLNYFSRIVKYMGNDYDGLSMNNNQRWGHESKTVDVDNKNGVSCMDMIDFNEKNIDGFDVREFYVELVSDLKDRGF